MQVANKTVQEIPSLDVSEKKWADLFGWFREK
jgi:hypothetical protein